MSLPDDQIAREHAVKKLNKHKMYEVKETIAAWPGDKLHGRGPSELTLPRVT